MSVTVKIKDGGRTTHEVVVLAADNEDHAFEQAAAALRAWHGHGTTKIKEPLTLADAVFDAPEKITPHDGGAA